MPPPPPEGTQGMSDTKQNNKPRGTQKDTKTAFCNRQALCATLPGVINFFFGLD